MVTSTTRVDGTTKDQSRLRPVRRRRRTVIRVLLLIVIALIAYAAFDLLGPRSSKMRSFDPNEVARLETAMWRSYY